MKHRMAYTTPDRVWENDALIGPADCADVPVKSMVTSSGVTVTVVTTSSARPGVTPSESMVKAPWYEPAGMRASSSWKRRAA
jgi:hypothetical protein